jgi:hypothetical protein
MGGLDALAVVEIAFGYRGVCMHSGDCQKAENDSDSGHCVEVGHASWRLL